MGRFSVEIRCVTGDGEIFRCKKDRTCDLSLFVIRRREGQYPRVKITRVTGKKMEGRSEMNRKHKQRQSGKDQRQSWIWERSGELANEGDTGCSDTVLSPGTRQ